MNNLIDKLKAEWKKEKKPIPKIWIYFMIFLGGIDLGLYLSDLVR